MSPVCRYDSKVPDHTPFSFVFSDCYLTCQALFYCFDRFSYNYPCKVERSLGNGICESKYSGASCGFDGGDCGYCALDCISHTGFLHHLGDGECQPQCDNEWCAFDAGDCVLPTQGLCNSGCFEGMLGNGECDQQCNTQRCGFDGGDCQACNSGCVPEMVGDGQCDEACHVAACQWDGTDCDCAPGCTLDRLSNDVCDPECNTSACLFDEYHCVSTTQGDCAASCFYSMVRDGHCDPPCNNAACTWDGRDCECAPGCSAADLGHCKEECLVPECGYDSTPEHDSPCFEYADYYTCDDAWCFASTDSPGMCVVPMMCCDSFYLIQFNCYDTCFDLGFSTSAVHPTVCLSATPASSPTSPQVWFVAPNSTDPAADGSLERPFGSLKNAFGRVLAEYVEVLLLPGEHPLVNGGRLVIDRDSQFYNPPDSIPFPKEVVIDAYACRLSALCDRVTISRNLYPGTYFLVEGFALTIANVVFVAEAGNLFMISGNESFVVVNKKGKLTLLNVVFHNFISSLPSLIFLNNSELELRSVDFIGLESYSKGIIETAVVVSQYSAKVRYSGGSVTLLNHNADFTNQLQTTGFFCLNDAEILIEDVVFELNLVDSYLQSAFRPECQALVGVKTCTACVVRDSVFRHNLGFRGTALRYTGSLWDGLLHSQQRKLQGDVFQVTNCTFANNTSSHGGTLYFSFLNQTQSLLVSNCSFLNELAAFGVVEVEGSSGGDYSVELTQVRFAGTKVMDYGVIALRRVPRAQLSSLTFEHIGGVDSETVYSTTLHAFESSDYVPYYPASSEPQPCSSALNISQVRVAALSDFHFTAQRCSIGMFATETTLSLAAVTLEEIAGSSVAGSALSVQSASFLHLAGVTVQHNINTHEKGHGVVYAEAAEAWIEHSLFLRNTASIGGSVFFNNAQRVVIASCVFEGNAGERGGALFFAAAYEAWSLTIGTSTFSTNTASASGGALEIAGVSSLQFSLYSSNFQQNSAVLVSAIVAQERMTITGSLMDCSFEGNTAQYRGVIDFERSEGNFTVVESRFAENVGGIGAVVFMNCEGVCSLTLRSTELWENSGQSVVEATGVQHVNATALLCTDNEGSCVKTKRCAFTCEECEFARNHATSGAGLYLEDYSAAVYRSAFTSNRADWTGGAVMTANAVFSCEVCTFSYNSAGWQGGAIFAQRSTLHLLTSRLLYNFSADSGFAVYLFMTSGTSTLVNTEFEGNTGKGYGTVSLLFTSANMANCTLRRNLSDRLTGGLLLHVSHAVVTDSVFEAQSGEWGALIYAYRSDAAVSTSRFSDAVAAVSGGGVQVISSAVDFVACTFSRLESPSGAALFLMNDASVKLENCTLVDLPSPDSQGLIEVQQSSLQVANCHFFNYTHSAIYAVQGAVSIASTLFENATATSGTALYCSACRSIDIARSTFSQLAAGQAAALYIQGDSEKGKWVIADSLFAENTGKESGAVVVKDAWVEVRNCTFQRNRATHGSGGALTLNSTSASCELQDNAFTSNIAAVNGGSVYWGSMKPQLLRNRFTHNSAQYGADIASYAVELSLQSALNLSAAPSGQRRQVYVSVALLDHYGQVVVTDNSSVANLNSTDKRTSFVGEYRVKAAKGEYIFDDFAVVAAPGSATSVQVESSTVSNSSVLLAVNMRQCVAGEAQVGDQCTVCSSGTYSLDPATGCLECPSEAYCYGNTTFVPKKGYWRAYALTDRFFTCPNPSACLGSPHGVNLTGECADGYAGNKCQSCQPGYYSWAEVYCYVCPSLAQQVSMQVFLIGLIAALLVLILRSVLRSSRSNEWRISLRTKIFINYLHFYMLLGSINLAWPTLMLSLFNATRSLGGFPEFTLSLRCYLQHYSDEDSYYAEVVLVSCAQVILLSLAVCCWLLVSRWKRVRDQFVSSCIVLFAVAYPSVVRTLCRVLRCEEIRSGEFWVVGVQARCWTASHAKYAFGLALPGVLVVGIGVPLGLLAFLVRQRNSVEIAVYRTRYGYLLHGYISHLYCWEFFVLGKKLLLVAWVAFGSLISESFQATGVLAIHLISLSLHHRYRPFENPSLNFLELKSHVVIIASLYSGLLFYSGLLGREAKIVVFTLLVTLNALFAVTCLQSALAAAAKQVLRTLKNFGKTKITMETSGNPRIQRS